MAGSATFAPAASPRTALAAEHATVLLGGATILPGISASIAQGQITALVGPNGSGKSTALRLFARLLRPTRGQVYLDGHDIRQLTPRALARALALLPQSPIAPSDLSVYELVAFGRFPHQGLLGRISAADREAIDWALRVTGLEAMAERSLETLSGGERQRAWIAMALAQRTGLLLLDEPTTFLDVRHQLEVLSLVRQLNRTHGVTVLWVLHDLNQAARYSDRIIALRSGWVVADGAPGTVITEPMVRDVFGVESTVLREPTGGVPLVIPLALAPLESEGTREIEDAATSLHVVVHPS